MTTTTDVKMFNGKDLSGLSGPNGVSQPDASDFAFLAGSTAAAGWLATNRNGGGNRLERFKDRAATRLEGAAGRATEARTAGQAEAAAARSAADAANKAGAKAATEAAEKVMAKNAAKGIAEQGAKLAAKKGAMLAARQLGTRAAAFAIGAAIPGPGWLVAAGVLVGSLLLDKDFRNMITGVFSSGMDINQPPAPPTTNWLPATDDNRQNDIAPADKRLTDMNNAVTGISPDKYKLWHLQESEVPGLTTMGEQLKALDASGTAITNLSNDYISALNNAPRMWGDSMREGRISVAQNIGQFKDKAGNPVGEALSEAAKQSNEVYQTLREGNAKAREQLSRSQGRFLGFVGGGSGADGLLKNLDGIEASNDALKRAEEAMHAAGADWLINPVGTDGDSKPEKLKSIDTPEVEPKPQVESPTVTPEPKPVEPQVAPTETKPEVEEPKPQAPETPAVETPQVQTPQVQTPTNPFAAMQQPSTPSLDDIMKNVPQVPQQPQEEPKIEDPEEDKKVEDKAPPKPEDPKPEPEAPEEPKPDDKAPEEPKPEAPAPDDAPPVADAPGDPKPDPNAKPVEKTVVEVDGKPVDFKDPKIAAMVEGILNGEEGTPVPLRNAAEAAGIRLPGEDQDIGKVADPNSMEPGTVIAGKDGNYVYIGDDQVLGEDKKIKPLSEVAVFDGEHEGIFTLDTGSPAPEVMPVAEEKPLGPGDSPGAKPADAGPQATGVMPPAAPTMQDQNGSPGNGSVFPTSPDKPIGLGGDNNGSDESPEPVIVPNDSKPSSDLPAPSDPGLPLSTDAPIDPNSITP